MTLHSRTHRLAVIDRGRHVLILTSLRPIPWRFIIFANRSYLIALLFLSASCAGNPAPDQGSASATPERVARNPQVISKEELQDPAIAVTDALTAIRQLRPAFFRDRGPQTLRSGDPSSMPGQVQVSQDYGQPQPMGALSGISTRTLVEVRYLTAVEAQARFGINANGGPMIVVLTMKQ